MYGSRQPTQYVNPYSGPTQPGAVGYVPSGTNYTQPVASNAAQTALASFGGAASGAAGGGGAATGAAVGGAAGSAVPVVGNILGAVAGATIGGIFDMIQGEKNRKQQQEMFDTQMKMANKQFDWGQELDRFNMDIASRQQKGAEKAQRFQITQAQVDRMNQVLRSNETVQNHIRSLWGGR